MFQFESTLPATSDLRILVFQLLEHYIEEYFDQNPISQLGILQTGNKRAETVTELSGNPRRHLAKLQALKERTCQGEPSLQNALELATHTLRFPRAALACR